MADDVEAIGAGEAAKEAAESGRRYGPLALRGVTAADDAEGGCISGMGDLDFLVPASSKGEEPAWGLIKLRKKALDSSEPACCAKLRLSSVVCLAEGLYIVAGRLIIDGREWDAGDG